MYMRNNILVIVFLKILPQAPAHPCSLFEVPVACYRSIVMCCRIHNSSSRGTTPIGEVIITSWTNLRYFPRALMNFWCDSDIEYGFFAEHGKSTSVSSSGAVQRSSTRFSNLRISTLLSDSEVLA